MYAHPQEFLVKKFFYLGSLWLALALSLLTGCSDNPENINPNTPLNVGNLNLVFVVSPDLTYQTPGDINPNTANLTPQGLNRSLLLATYLKNQVLGGRKR